MEALNRKRRFDHLIGAAIAIAYLLVLLGTARDVGFSRDEGFYFTAAKRYQRWFDVLAENPSKALNEQVIERHWKYNREHPALMKTLFAFSHRTLHQKLEILSPATAYRFPGMVAAALGLYILFIFGSHAFGRAAGAFAALGFALMPRIFYHAHLACFDVAVTTAWLGVTYLYWRSLSSWKFGLAAGIAFAMALTVKLNIFFMPFVLGGHYAILMIYRLVMKKRGAKQRGTAQSDPSPKPWAFVFGGFIGPLVFFAHWPWLWHNTWDRLLFYVGFHSAHPFYNTAWFGENIIEAPTPLLLPTVMTAMTVPTIILVLFGIGVILRLRRRARPGTESNDEGRGGQGLDLLLLVSALFPIALISHPNVPIFGGTKHWMPAYPFIALFGGAAIARLISIVCERWPKLNRLAASVVIVALCLAPPFQQTIQSHPMGLATYVPFAGGAPGAATLGMTRQFWGYTTASVAPWLNENMDNGAVVSFHDTSLPSVRMFKTEEIVRKDIRIGGLRRAKAALLHHELHMVVEEAWIWNAYGTIVPSHVATHQGVPIVSVYERPGRKKKPPIE